MHSCGGVWRWVQLCRGEEVDTSVQGSRVQAQMCMVKKAQMYRSDGVEHTCAVIMGSDLWRGKEARAQLCMGEGAHLCRGGTLSCVRRLPRVDTTLKLSAQSHCTCR